MDIAPSLIRQLKGRHLLVIGLGATGVSCVRFLRSLGVRVSVADSRAQPPGVQAVAARYPEVAVTTGSLAPHLLGDADGVVVSPGVADDAPILQAARRRGLDVVSDVELFAQAIEGGRVRVLAVTGSNGKSTVTTLAAKMIEAAGLRVAAGANLGRPALDLLDDDVDAYVLELSSFQLERTRSLRSDAAVVLNLSADHMDRHGSMERYAAIKARIYRGAGVAVLNRDDAWVAAMPERIERAPTRIIGFTLGEPRAGDYGLVGEGDQRALCRGARRLLPVSALHLQGMHNVGNALAALALTDTLGLPEEPMLEALSAFTGLAHRCQWVAERGGVTWINDSKATNLGATLAALDGLPGPIVLLAGGQAKGADLSPLGPALRGKGRAAILFGEDAGLIEAALGDSVPVQRVTSMAEAVAAARKHAREGDVVLLSPACASLDMFRNYADRGDQFTAAVREAQP